MILNLLKFEWLLFKKNRGFYVLALLFFFLGMLVTAKANFQFPEVYKNAPYSIGFLVVLFAPLNILSVTILAAQMLLRERDTNFQHILYATPVKKAQLLVSRTLVISLTSAFNFLLMIAGFAIGFIFSDDTTALLPHSSAWHFIQPFLLFGIPDIIFCTAVICSIGWLGKNKLMIYVGGLLLYILYIVIAIFSNSPLMANVSPVSDAAMALSAKLDPFGAAAFFDQTRYWNAIERNSDTLRLSGNILFNRALWLGISLVLLLFSMKHFRLATRKNKKNTVTDNPAITPDSREQPYQPVPIQDGTHRYGWQVVKSYIKTDASFIFKSIAFIVAILLLVFVTGMEIYSDIEAGIRLPQRYANTGLMLNNIIRTIPFICLCCIVFFSSELIHRSKSNGMHLLENSTPVKTHLVFLAKLLTVCILSFTFISISIFTGIVFQLIYNYNHIDAAGYLSLYYLVLLPLICSTAIIMCMQALIKNKYAGLAAAGAFILLCHTDIGRAIGIRNPLLRPGAVFSQRYSEMSGWGAYLTPFALTILYSGGLALLLSLIAVSFRQARSAKRRYLIATSAFVTLLCGTYIFFQANILHPTASTAEQDSWQQQYEEKYRKYQQVPQPAIVSVKTFIDLFPEKNSYHVRGSYCLLNKSGTPIDSLLIYLDRSCLLQELKIANGRLIEKDELFGHYLFKMDRPLMPNDSLQMEFSFQYHWSPFTRHDPFNAVVQNGSFMRISNYFPLLGYQPGNELENEKIRAEKKMPAPTGLLSFADSSTGNKDFIQLDMTISTSKDQTAIGVGELLDSWSREQRSYFHYSPKTPVPFRFAVSSAAYAVKRDSYNGKPVLLYYYPEHFENVDRLIETAKKTLAYCEKNFGPYPYATIRFAEVSSFTSGFAATAYPASVFMTENMVFHVNIGDIKNSDVINELSAHELSHQWWGGVPLYPADKEGSRLLTETLAMYTEMMMNKAEGDSNSILNMVKLHKTLYFGDRSYYKEKPLYLMEPGQNFLAYNKGLVSMYQLYLIIGEEKINTALHNLLQQSKYPSAAVSTDFLAQLYAVSPDSVHSRIDDLFKKIIIHDTRVTKAEVKRNSTGKYDVTVEGNFIKYSEDGNGHKTVIDFNGTVDLAIYDKDGRRFMYKAVVANKQFLINVQLDYKPVKVSVDPDEQLMDPDAEDNHLNF
ncbi:MAG: M1 family aminopeptidase [Ferruginibacter sp.]